MSEENPGNDRTKQENKRQYELTDQLLSMHSSLRDKYERRAFLLNTALMGISLFLCVFAFVGDNVLESLGYHPPMARFVFGLSAAIVLTLSITEFRVDWRTTGARHAEAVKHLAGLKAEYRKEFNESSGNDSEKNSTLTNQYDKTMEKLPPIPEQHFNKLKANHQFKRILSQRLSQNPKAPEWFLRIQLRLEGIRAALKKEGTNRAGKGRAISND